MAKTTVGKYLTTRLRETGLGHVFGIPGDYVLRFYDLLVESPLQLVGTCTEIGAGYAADAYARVNGLGCVCVTYCVGGLNVLNAVAGAYAEKSPLIVISGAPGMGERARSPLLHHQVRDFHTQLQIYEKVTCAAVAIEDPADAPRLIDETIAACLLHKRPVYIELPRDMVDAPCAAPKPIKHEPERSEPKVLAEAVAEASALLKTAKNPVILAGVELHRYGLQESLLALVKRSGYPVAGTLLGKSVMSERHPQYLGIYEGAMGSDEVRRVVESADCLLILGAPLTDIDLGGFTAKLDPSRTINVEAHRVSIRRHHFDGVSLGDFIKAVARAPIGATRRNVVPPKPTPTPFKPRPTSPVTVQRIFQRINEYLDAHTVVICDIGDSLFGAADLTIHERTEFISPAYYTSMGFAVPAALGAQVGRRSLRPLVFVGDGAFQMTGQEISSIVRQKLNPIIIVLNNKGYTTERYIREGPYNNIHDWAFHLWPQIVREGWGTEVRTEGEFETALARARKNDHCFSILNVHLEPMDGSAALKRLGERLGRSVSAKSRRK